MWTTFLSLRIPINNVVQYEAIIISRMPIFFVAILRVNIYLEDSGLPSLHQCHRPEQLVTTYLSDLNIKRAVGISQDIYGRMAKRVIGLLWPHAYTLLNLEIADSLSKASVLCVVLSLPDELWMLSWLFSASKLQLEVTMDDANPVLLDFLLGNYWTLEMKYWPEQSTLGIAQNLKTRSQNSILRTSR